MPLYEYKAVGRGCEYCLSGFEVIQSMSDEHLTHCPECHAPIRKLMSRFYACIIDTPEEVVRTDRKIREYEKEGMWSHAAELADKTGLEERARDNYKKAGYDM